MATTSTSSASSGSVDVATESGSGSGSELGDDRGIALDDSVPGGRHL